MHIVLKKTKNNTKIKNYSENDLPPTTDPTPPPLFSSLKDSFLCPGGVPSYDWEGRL